MPSIFKWSKVAADNSNSDPDINWQEGQFPGTVNNSARALEAAVANARDDQGGQLTTAGTQPAYTLTTNSVLTALADGTRLHFVAHATNTGAATLNVDSLGAKALRKGGDTALASGDIVSGAHYIVQYDASANSAAGAWLLPVGIPATAPVATFLGLTDTPDDYTDDGTKVLAVNSGATAVEFIAKNTVGVGKQSIWVPAGAMISRSTNGAFLSVGETTTNRVMRQSLDFDATTQEFAQFQVAAPKSWNEGTVTFQVFWTHPATTVNFGVVWELQGLSISNDDPQEAAFGTAVEVADTGGTTDDVYITAESAAVTLAGTPAEGDLLVFQIARDPANGSDTMAVDARLLGVMLLYTTNANTDD